MMPKSVLIESVLKAEKEIDNFYLTSPFINLNRIEALWYLLCAAEENCVLISMGREARFKKSFVLVDSMKYVLKYCMNWLFESCPTGGQVPKKCDPKLKRLAHEFLTIGFEYQIFVLQYSLAYSGIRTLKTDGNDIIVDDSTEIERRHNAYNNLILPTLLDKPDLIENEGMKDLIEIVGRTFRIKGDSFTYRLKPRDIIIGIEIIDVFHKYAYELPPDWNFSNYSLDEFRKTYSALSSIITYHNIAYVYSLRNKPPAGGFLGNIYTFKKHDLINRLIRYTGLSKDTVDSIFTDLTYGSHNFDNPDPALQPIIPIAKEIFAIVPTLFISSSPERNLVVLMNRIPKERQIYSKIKNKKESLMRDKIKDELKDYKFRYWSGKISRSSKLPDIDLVIIDDAQKILLLCELKWFIEPAEIQEVVQKSEEIKTGIEQVNKLKNEFDEVKKCLDKKLTLDSIYKYVFVVISENFTGLSYVQDDNIAVINSAHLVSKIKKNESLKDLDKWLKRKDYLPVENIHYETHTNKYSLGKWSISHLGYESLIDSSLMNYT